MRQTSLFPKQDTSKPPYNGLFFCHIRGGMYRWNEFINYYKVKRL